MASKLSQLKTLSTIVADTGDLKAIRTYWPVDCTTDPSLVLEASRMPRSAALVSEAVEWSGMRSQSPWDHARKAAIRLGVLLGRAATRIVPGRVSIEVDPRLSFDSAATEAQADDLIDQFRNLGIDRSRILIKIAATWEGIHAARSLQSRGIDCNLTLIFNEVQAFAAADADAFLVSPFVSRFADRRGDRPESGGIISEDPGVNFVRGLYQSFNLQGRGTIVMAGSFRSVGQVEALAGCDRLAIAPDLLKQLMESEGEISRLLEPPQEDVFVPAPVVSETAFRCALSQDAIANEKLFEGIRGFVSDTEVLEQAIVRMIKSGTVQAGVADDAATPLAVLA